MKNIYFLFLILFIQTANAQYTAIPDLDFEQELITQGIDTDLSINGQVLTSDINSLTSLYINYNNLHNIIGIQDFTSLQYLDVEFCSNLTEIDLGGNLNLLYLSCNNNNLTNINISNNLLLEIINCGFNHLTVLDVSNNINLGAIYCSNNNLTNLEVSNNINLLSIICDNNNITNLDVSNNINLDSLSCHYNYITNLDVTNNINLVQFFCAYNQLTTLNISNNTHLKLLYCGHNQLTSLTITNVPLFVSLQCNNNNLTTLNTDTIPSIQTLFCANNNLTSLNLNNNSSLNILYCNNNNLSSLVIQNNANNLLNNTYTIYTTPPSYHNRFDSTGNPNLHCIFVDNVANCNSNWPGRDLTSNYVSTQQECDNLSNETFTINNGIIVYPNPTNGILNINSNNNIIKNIIIYDLLGKVVLEKSNNFEQLNISNLTNGLYLLKITRENEIFIMKIIKN